jgi:hypothetical protein
LIGRYLTGTLKLRLVGSVLLQIMVNVKILFGLLCLSLLFAEVSSQWGAGDPYSWWGSGEMNPRRYWWRMYRRKFIVI